MWKHLFYILSITCYNLIRGDDMKKKYYIYEININILNIISILLLVLMSLLSFILNKTLLIKSFIINDYFIFILGFVCYLIIHEILHSISYVTHGAKFKNIIYGMALEKGVLYCLCKENINKKNILISLMYPLFFIGILTYIVSLIFVIQAEQHSWLWFLQKNKIYQNDFFLCKNLKIYLLFLCQVWMYFDFWIILNENFHIYYKY